MTKLELFHFFRPLLIRVTGVPEIILADPNAPAPQGSYGALRIDDHSRQFGQAIQRQVVTDKKTIVTEIDRQLVRSMTINFYRTGALEYAHKIAEFQKFPSVIDEMKRKRIGVDYVGPVQNLTTLFAGVHEERTSVNIDVWHNSVITDEVNTIEHANLTIEDEKARKIAQFDVKIYD